MQRFRKSPWFNKVPWLTAALVLSLAALPGASVAANPIEDVEWGLVELDGKELTVNPGTRRPFIRFDASKSRASGDAGCNNFFGGYTVKKSSLSFGPIGSTRRACGDAQDTMEITFLKALGATRSWGIRKNRLLLLDNDKVLARFEKADP